MIRAEAARGVGLLDGDDRPAVYESPNANVALRGLARPRRPGDDEREQHRGERDDECPTQPGHADPPDVRRPGKWCEQDGNAPDPAPARSGLRCEDAGVDGVHDLGGMQGFGPVEVEPDEPTFHGEWEARTFAVAGGALGAGGFNTPMFRHAIERMDPGHYLTSSYFEHWLTAVATLLVEEGMISRDDLDARVRLVPAVTATHGGRRRRRRRFPARGTPLRRR